MKLDIRQIRVAYEEDAVLEQLSLQMAQGEFLSLLGPSGCGKSTLLKAIAGIVPISRGSILLDGEDITHKRIHQRGTVVVFQDMRLFPHMSILHNVAFPLKMQGMAKAERLKIARDILQKVQLEGLEDRLPDALSGGQQQRAALARALAAKPRLLLLDEPFSALDENLREEMRALVLSLHREFGMTTVLVTHDREEALSMSHRVALMFGGAIAQIGTPREVYRRPCCRQVADYFGNGVYVDGTVREGFFTGGGIRIPTARAEGDYTLLLRPDDLNVSASGSYELEVTAATFRGSDLLLTLRAEDGTVWKKAFPADTSLKPGHRIRAAVKAEEPVLFPR